MQCDPRVLEEIIQIKDNTILVKNTLIKNAQKKVDCIKEIVYRDPQPDPDLIMMVQNLKQLINSN